MSFLGSELFDVFGVDFLLLKPYNSLLNQRSPHYLILNLVRVFREKFLIFLKKLYYKILYSSKQNSKRRFSVNIQYKKGVIELCILAILSKKDRYGYELSELISKRIEISDGTVYPILRKLKADGLVKTYLSEDSGGLPRKYYSLTQTGKIEFENDSKEWLIFTEIVNKMIKGEI